MCRHFHQYQSTDLWWNLFFYETLSGKLNIELNTKSKPKIEDKNVYLFMIYEKSVDHKQVKCLWSIQNEPFFSGYFFYLFLPSTAPLLHNFLKQFSESRINTGSCLRFSINQNHIWQFN